MKNTIVKLLEEKSRVHFKGRNYEVTKELMTGTPIILRWKADSILEEAKEYTLSDGEKAIDAIIWKWYNKKEGRWVDGSQDEG